MADLVTTHVASGNMPGGRRTAPACGWPTGDLLESLLIGHPGGSFDGWGGLQKEALVSRAAGQAPVVEHRSLAAQDYRPSGTARSTTCRLLGNDPSRVALPVVRPMSYSRVRPPVFSTARPRLSVPRM
ncbi:hypothetical protein EV648_11532 [Kribbella sp. VKM Ac-2568]|nr:hypothetical protein EV648_11532 [Kribbella sp. VKM Ac-2568]